MSASAASSVSGTLQVFGHEDTTAELKVVPRGAGWRATRAGGFILGGLLAAPVVALLPPHVAWAMAAVLTGLFFGLRKWAERHTLMELSGPCPRCGATIHVGSATRLRNPWTVSCESCRHAATLTVASEELPEPA
jgi:hypothetical protein